MKGEMKMDKALAQEIFMLQLEEAALHQKKWDLKEKHKLKTWDNACLEAMKFQIDGIGVGS